MKRNFIKFFSFFAIILMFFCVFSTKNIKNVYAKENILGQVVTIGEAKILLKADIAKITAIITETDSELITAKDIAFDKFTQAKTELINLGVEEKDININYFSTYPVFDNFFERGNIGYHATLSFEYELNNLENVASSVDAILGVGITYISKIDYQVKNFEDECGNLLNNAIANATEKAMTMLNRDDVVAVGIIEQETHKCLQCGDYNASQSQDVNDNQIEIYARVKIIFE